MLLPILFTAAFIALSVPVIMAPLRRQTQVVPEAPGKTQTNNSSPYDDALLALRDLEFDHDLGVVSDEDFARLRPQLMAQAASALETGQKEQVQRIADDIEAAVRARRGQTQQRSAPVGRFCAQCGRPRDRSDRFCAGCGASFQ